MGQAALVGPSPGQHRPPAQLAKEPRSRVVILDRDGSIFARASEVLTQRGYRCERQTSESEARESLSEHHASVLLHNTRADAHGFEFARSLRDSHPDLGVLLVGADTAMREETAIAGDPHLSCLPLGFGENELAVSVARLAEMTDDQRASTQLYRDSLVVRRIADRAREDVGMVAESPQSALLFFFVHRVAPTRATVLVEGESGTGKELIARLLHQWSHRSSGPFVAVNCKAIAAGTLESELFGHERGSFTGAIAEHAGCFERASGGTLFLDELADTAPEFQAKLLRVLETGELLRVGGSHPCKVDVRVVAATNRVLRQEVAAGRFREDLFFRLNVITLRLPALRDRPEDVLPLARHFLSRFAVERGIEMSLSPPAERELLSHRWPGNVRELQNAIHRAVVLSSNGSLTAEVLGLHERERSSGDSDFFEGTLREFSERAKAQRIRIALEQARGNHSQAAATLGINRATLYRLLQRLHIEN